MKPKVAQSSCESGEGIATMRCLLNDLHHPRAGLQTSLFFEEGAPITVENNMPKVNWFTPNPYSVEAGILASKWCNYRRGFPLMKDYCWTQWINELEPIFKKKWMNNDIYELIMLSKTTVIAKPELLTTALLFWNSGTNTFNFKIGTMSLTILDMAQVFGLRPSGRVVDVTHDWSPSSRLTAEIGEPVPTIGQSYALIPSTPPPSLVVTPTSQFNPSTGDMLHFVKDSSNSSSSVQETNQPPTISFREPIVLESPVVSEGLGEGSAKTTASTPRASPPAKTASTVATSEGAGKVHSPLVPISVTTSLLELFKEFRQLNTRLRKDFSASFSLKALYDVKKAIIELHKADQLSKVQYESFLSYFENLRTLMDQH
ncbi:hypothetical protein D8674_041197 [Pyrus ussuriensis x Pyrus communis]|uniref:Aminotransferase-like plant mobile domain-containing protein n=1 Tax=Pyrus ussuriensis x Pyrus communis TaxID=2448454 RepID=A0A5N5F7J5_9ROSA|nr:hypothetical protein D8674_041197 [Pyrus ussuriensis x Pyrus communis]